MGNYYPPLGFHFLVEFGDEKDQSQFQSVSGLTVDIETEEIREGGENRFKHKLPVRARYPNLVLKRGLDTNSKLLEWCQKASEGFEFEPADLVIKLLNQENEPLLSWNVVNAYPVKWAVSEFNAEESRVVIETIELTYSYFKTL
jgi:phage tail-like protein